MGGALVKPGAINLQNKILEQRVLSISAKVANAVDMVQRAKKMTIDSENMLIEAQLELEELYIALDKQRGVNDNEDSK